MGSMGVASNVTILVLSLSILFFFTNLSSVKAQTVAPPPLTCPELRVCANLAQGLLKVGINNPDSRPCCSLISGLADVEVVLCLCATIRVNLAIVDVNLALKVLLDTCGRSVPEPMCPT